MSGRARTCSTCKHTRPGTAYAGNNRTCEPCRTQYTSWVTRNNPYAGQPPQLAQWATWATRRSAS